MLCPNCLKQVDRFNRTDTANLYACPTCKESVPLLYERDYDKYRPVVFSLVGLPGHGKTVYLSSLLYEFERMGSDWPGFSYTALDESGMRTVREKQRALQRGDLPESTRKVFPKPVVLQLDGLPDVGRCHVLLNDTAGEVFEQVSDMKQYASYVSRSPVVLWLVSLSDLESPEALSDFLTVYTQAVLELGGEVREQTLLIVLTKADEMVTWDGVPEEIKHYIDSNDWTNDPDAWEKLSGVIEEWLENQMGYINFVRLARKRFGRVVLTLVSSLGSKPEGRKHVAAVSPRGVLMPLFFVINREKEHWEEQRHKMEKEEQVRAERDKERKEAERRLLDLQRERQKERDLKRKKIGRVAVAGFLLGPVLWAALSLAWGVITGAHTAVTPSTGLLVSAVLGVIWGGVSLEVVLESGCMETLIHDRGYVIVGALLSSALFTIAFKMIAG